MYKNFNHFTRFFSTLQGGSGKSNARIPRTSPGRPPPTIHPARVGKRPASVRNVSAAHICCPDGSRYLGACRLAWPLCRLPRALCVPAVPPAVLRPCRGFAGRFLCPGCYPLSCISCGLPPSRRAPLAAASFFTLFCLRGWQFWKSVLYLVYIPMFPQRRAHGAHTGE